MTAIPLYQRIGDDLRQRIARGEWPVDGKLPGRHALARHYGVDLRTLQRAIAGLLADGTCRAVDRQGTYVAAETQAVVDCATTHSLYTSDIATPHATALGSRRTAILGIVTSLGYDPIDLPQHQHEWTPTILNSIEREFSAHYGRTHVSNATPPEAPSPCWTQAVRQALDMGSNAIAVIDTHGMALEYLSEIYALCMAAHLPIIYMSCATVNITVPIPHVFYDLRHNGYLAAQHLLHEGYRDLYVLAPYSAEWLSERIAGVHAAVAHASLPAVTVRISTCRTAAQVNEFQPQLVDQLVQRVVAEDEVFASPADPAVPLAIIAANDVLAYGVLAVAAASGYLAGRDFGLIGFDDYPRSRALGLTTLRPPLEAMGTTVARLLWRALDGEDMPLQVRLHSQLITRLSTHRHREAYTGV